MPARLLLIVLFLSSASLAAAQSSPTAAPPPPASPFGITDNSFLIEEAFNQEAGIFQNIFVFSRRSADAQWDGSFTQEWPVPGQRHQLSFTVPFSAASNQLSLGDLAFNYRLQVTDGEGRAPAIAPRLTLLAPSSAEDRSLGWQFNLPVSQRVGRMYFHGNAGTTLVQVDDDETTSGGWSKAPFAGGSAIAAVTPMFNLMLESLVVWTRAPGVRETSSVVSPGFRLGWNLGEKQIVIGAGVPITRGDQHDNAVLGYFSYELPFRR